MELSQLSDQHLSNKMVKQEMYIPADDIVTIIFNRLPSTSIIRFQTVSKHWCYLIRSYILKACSKSSLMSVQFTKIDSGKLALFNFDDEGKIKKTVVDTNIGGLSNYELNYELSNMVNGFACAYGNISSTNFYLINLTTLEASKYSKRKIKGFISYENIILGFDPCTGLNKFVRIYSYRGSHNYHCEILENSDPFERNWKIVGRVPLTGNIDNPVYLNGAIHWVMKPQWSSDDKRKPLAFDILKLDMKKERFEMMDPILQNEYDDCHCQICDFILTEEKGKLYLLHYCLGRKYLEGWRLEEGKRDRTWNVVFRVNFASMIGKEQGGLISNYEHASLAAAGIADGKVLMRRKKYGAGIYIQYDRVVYIYDLVHKKLSEHRDVYHCSFSSKYRVRRIPFHHRDV